LAKKTYLLILLVFSSYFWGVTIFQNFDRDSIFLSTIVLALVPFVFFKKNKYYTIFLKKYHKYTFVIFLGVVLSMFSAYIFWNQSFLQTLISQRYIYLFVLLSSVLYLTPTENQFFWAIKYFSYLTIAAWTLSIFFIESFISSEEVLNYRLFGDSTEIGASVNGIRIVVIYFYYVLHKSIKGLTKVKFLEIFILFSFIVLFQNRSVIVGLIIPLIYFLVKFKTKYKFITLSLLFASFSIFLYSNYNVFDSLIKETKLNLNDEDYARYRSLNYYFSDYSPHPICYFTGNGRININTDNFKIQKLNNDGIYDSDIGLFGMLITYGLIPVSLVCLILFRILFQSRQPLYLKFISTHILIIPTYFHFWDNPNILMFIIIIYFYLLNSKYRMSKNMLKT
tara:strand:- start:1406 stop:2587 length:1182 start_codon:yes stop_codon:yes gene_type:complete